jgi:hypothetical protein
MKIILLNVSLMFTYFSYILTYKEVRFLIGTADIALNQGNLILIAYPKLTDKKPMITYENHTVKNIIKAMGDHVLLEIDVNNAHPQPTLPIELGMNVENTKLLFYFLNASDYSIKSNWWKNGVGESAEDYISYLDLINQRKKKEEPKQKFIVIQSVTKRKRKYS